MRDFESSPLPPKLLMENGVLPIRNMVVRFAIGDPKGTTSNSWRIWKEASGIYIACRDNFKEVKISLHQSGRWRIGFTEESIRKRPELVHEQQDRAWEVWDEPGPSLPDTIVALRLFFFTSELAVKPEQRMNKTWKNVMFIEAAPPGKLTALSLFITKGEPHLRHETEPSFLLASFDIGDGRAAQLVVHGEPEGSLRDELVRSVTQAAGQAAADGVELPPTSFGYFWGRQSDGCRFMFPARIQEALT